MGLRDYQQEDLGALREAMRAGARHVLFEASVGYGKSLLIETLAAAYSAVGRPVWVLSNRSAVINQLRSRAAHMPGVEVMTVQAADRRRASLAAHPAHLVLIDEAHMGGAAAQYRRVMACAPMARCVAFTGTPTPGLFDVFPDLVKGRGAKWLTRNGWLAPLRYHAPQKLDMRNIPLRDGDYDPNALLELLDQRRIYGDAIESYREFGLGAPSLGFCINVKHAQAIADRFQDAGHPCGVLIGADNEKDVARKIDMLKDGGLIFSVDKVSAGFDLPDIRCLLSLRPTKSEQLWVQQLGRGARAADGKEHCWIADHADNARKLGPLTEERDWRNQEETKAQRMTEDGQSLAIRTCEICLAIFEAGPSCCPKCGEPLAKEKRLPKAESSRLAEIAAAELERARIEEKARKQTQREENARKEAEEKKARAAQREAEREQRSRIRAQLVARNKILKRMGGGYRQKRGFQVHQLGKSWAEAHHIAIEQLKKRLDDALRTGDVEVIEVARAELEAHA